MGDIVDILVRQVKGDDLTIVRVDADMKFAPGSALRSSVLFKQPFARAAQLQLGAVDNQMRLPCSRR